MTCRHAEFAALLMLLAGAAFAQPQSGSSERSRDDGRTALDALRPTGPVTIKADRVDWVQDRAMQYSGNVSLSSSTLAVRGSVMDVQQAADGHFVATIRGEPAQLDHAPVAEASGIAAQPVHAEAREIRYDSRAGTADLLGAARLARGKDEIRGESIGYIIAERRIRAASGGSAGQVTITFEPPPAKTTPKKNSPERTP